MKHRFCGCDLVLSLPCTAGPIWWWGLFSSFWIVVIPYMFWCLQSHFRLVCSFIRTECFLPIVWGHSGKKRKVLLQSLQQRPKGTNVKWQICLCYDLEIKQQWKVKIWKLLSTAACLPLSAESSVLWVQPETAASRGRCYCVGAVRLKLLCREMHLLCMRAGPIAASCAAGRQQTFGAYGFNCLEVRSLSLSRSQSARSQRMDLQCARPSQCTRSVFQEVDFM